MFDELLRERIGRVDDNGGGTVCFTQKEIIAGRDVCRVYRKASAAQGFDHQP